MCIRDRATGRVELYEGRPQMAIAGPVQMRVMGPAGSSQVVPTVATDPEGTITWREAGRYLGQRVTVAGEVVRTYNSGKAAFLNFAKDYQGTFTVVIFADDFAKWSQAPEELYRDQLVRVTGKVKEYRGAPEIIVDDPTQIEIMVAGEEARTAAQLPEADQAEMSTGVTEEPRLVSWEEASLYEGQRIAVEGRVVDTYKSSKVVFLNFSPDRSEFKAVIFASAWDRWPRAPHELYYGQKVCITGTVVIYENTPEIILDGPEQISIVQGAEGPMEP
jgi:DNA/RNA endonuclease YhcR with UshA esterase domain